MNMKTNKVYVGDLIVSEDMEIDFEEITGNLRIKSGAKFTAKHLKTVGGHVAISSNAELPKLKTVSGDMWICSGAKLNAPMLTTMGGDVSIYVDATLTAPKLETVGGDVFVYVNATLTAPKLETVGGYLFINSKAQLTAPKLRTVGGDVSINSKAELPKLVTVGGVVSIYSNAELPRLLNKSDEKAKTIAEAALDLSFKKKGLIKADGILSWLFSRKKVKDLVVYKVKIVGKQNFSFVIERNGQFSHGETVAKAMESLRYKLTDRDTSRFKKWKLDTKISVEDAIQAYRAITGACEFGVKSFCESVKIPKQITVSEVIDLTKGKYGNKDFKKFFGVSL
jgi:hypothetical protein